MRTRPTVLPGTPADRLAALLPGVRRAARVRLAAPLPGVRRASRVRLGVAGLAGTALLAGCGDQLLRPAAPLPPLMLSLSLTPSAAVAGTAEAFARTDAAHVRFASSTRLVLDTLVARSSTGDGGFPLWLRIPNPGGAYQITVDLSSQGRALFHGSAMAQLRRGRRDSVVVTVAPIVAGVVAPDSAPMLTALGDSVRASAAVVFASGDTVSGLLPSWADDGTGVVRVAASGVVTALKEGSAQLTASYQGFTASTRVRVQATVAQVVLPQDSVSVSAASSTTLTASALDRNGNVLVRAFTWQSSDPSTATVDSAGVVHAVAPGRALISVSAGGQSASVVVVVRAIPVARVTVTPDAPTLVPGDTLRLQATPLDAAGHPLTGGAITWSTSDPAVATVDATGLVTAVADGSATLSAASGGQVGQATLVVGRPVLIASLGQASLAGATGSGVVSSQATVTNAGTGIIAGLSVSVSYAPGEPAGWLNVTLSSTVAPATITLSADLRQLGPGVYHALVTVTSTSRGASPITLAVQVTVGAPVATISLSATSPSVTVNGQQTLTATPRDASGAPLPYAVTWTSLDPTIVLVSSTGVLTGVAPGTGRVVATAGGVSDTVVVTVVEGGGSGGGGDDGGGDTGGGTGGGDSGGGSGGGGDNGGGSGGGGDNGGGDNGGGSGGTTRSQGFWATHESLTRAVWLGGSVAGNTFTGVADRMLCGRELGTIGQVLGGFWASGSQTASGEARSPLDRTRMPLLQQLLAAILNQAAFGSSPAEGTSIAEAKAAYCGTDPTAMKSAAEAMGAFNSSGENGVFAAGVSADATQAKQDADPAFWDVLP